MINNTLTGNGTVLYLAPTLLCAAAPTLLLILIILLICFVPRKIRPRLIIQDPYPCEHCLLSRLPTRRPVIEHHGLWVVEETPEALAQVETPTMEAPLEDPQTQTS